MAVDFFFSPATVALPTLDTLRDKWAKIPRLDVREMIVLAEQYLFFHRVLLEQVYFTESGQLGAPPWQLQLDISVRAGAIKVAALVCASIVEAALRAHAEYRGYALPPESHRRTYGQVLKAWTTGEDTPHDDVKAIWGDLKRLQDLRNDIHLFRGADRDEHFESFLQQEKEILTAGERAIEHLSQLRSSASRQRFGMKAFRRLLMPERDAS